MTSEAISVEAVRPGLEQEGRPPAGRERPSPDRQRTFQLVVATIWLTDAVLQIQPFMFAKGANGFSGMLSSTAAGNPGVVAHTITWNAGIVDHHPVLTNTLFALFQFAIGFGMASRRTLRPALALSIAWSIGVWWFGEGAGGVFRGSATPLAGGPGGVLFYALLAVLLWPRAGSDHPFVAARAVGAVAAKRIWVGFWGLMAVLALVGSGRQPQALHDAVTGLADGEPGWLQHIDRDSAAYLLHHGTAVAIVFAVLCLVAAVSVYVSAQFTQLMIVIEVVSFAAIWVAVQNLGGILAGGATDPNSAPLVILVVLCYWPLSGDRRLTSPDVTMALSTSNGAA